MEEWECEKTGGEKMVLRFETWFKAIHIRRSRRTYIVKQIEMEIKHSLENLITQLNEQYEGVRLVFVEKAPDPLFVGSVGPYGKITGAPAYFALVKTKTSPFLYEKAGFIGQAIVLEAVRNGLSTCWVGGYFNREVAAQNIKTNENEEVLAIIPVGYARKNLSLTEKMMYKNDDYHKRKSIEDIVFGLPMEKWPKWVKEVITAASLSPSAYNRQAITFDISETGDTVALHIHNPTEETNVPKELDRGIVMLHMEVALKHLEISGQWNFDEATNNVSIQIR